MWRAPTTTRIGRAARLALALSLLTYGCTTSSEGTSDAGVGVIPGDPGWQPVQPPDQSICIGVNPGPEAWALSEAIARAAAEAAALADAEGDTLTDAASDLTGGRGDAEGDTLAEADASAEGDAMTAGDVADGPPSFTPPTIPTPPSEDVDPCDPTWQSAADCVGTTPAPFVAYDFQPQSCGFGATYGLDVFKGEVTFLALFASW